MTRSHRQAVVAALASLALMTAAACGSDDDSSEADVERPTIVVTTNILGDVVGEVVGDSADVVTIMPVGADPHDFQASAQEVDEMMNADAMIVNGADFEEGLLDAIAGAEAEGVPTYEAISAVDPIDFVEEGHDHSDEEHSDEEEHEDEHEQDEGSHEGHDHSGEDPHFFTDPTRMAAAVEGMLVFLQAEIEFADPAALAESAADYIAELEALDADSVAQFETIPEESRVLVTNHESLGYFADRYDFEIAGVVIPGGSTTDAASAGELAELAEVIEHEGVRAIFADTSSSDELAQTLADEVGGVEVVELFTESLGDDGSGGETYLLMIGTNAERVTAGLT